ncbi:uncharacterized protein CANTADRAFT_225915 [Suhomyces tanzawaensis NRRL Y-17324]|uniref:Uncharacterized protein n=1 Tax=Suhomyces tanzawaensis NRRL Y-17324 TaxID=984487 RepID=A0A1E4SKL9_9ASCO|nr:uncharacterized protein CANTADRAFT_225915 [Suhomyces tanzawaensis NRRL Y-17324]ODV80056.1 hypothetical protein CANTADRAFT_225915 [Suhomyces tanzawaensis NRRL Y-17324]
MTSALLLHLHIRIAVPNHPTRCSSIFGWSPNGNIQRSIAIISNVIPTTSLLPAIKGTSAASTISSGDCPICSHFSLFLIGTFSRLRKIWGTSQLTDEGSLHYGRSRNHFLNYVPVAYWTRHPSCWYTFRPVWTTPTVLS